MTTAWLQYWSPEQLKIERQSGSDGDPLGHTAGEQFDKVAVGDSIYVLGREGASLLLVGRLTVDDKLDQRAADRRLGGGAFTATVHLVGSGTRRSLDRRITRRDARRLRRSSGSPLVDAEGNVDGKRLQRVGALGIASAALLDQFLDRDDVEIAIDGYREGASIERRHRAVERHPGLRDAALRIHGPRCMVCDFSFEATYGPRGSGFAEVHHRRPLSDLRGKTVLTNPATDVCVLCANCHRMVHRGDDAPVAIDVLRAAVRHPSRSSKSTRRLKASVSACPQCQSRRTAPVAIGFPSPEMERQAARGELILGGDVLTSKALEAGAGCLECGARW